MAQHFHLEINGNHGDWKFGLEISSEFCGEKPREKPQQNTSIEPWSETLRYSRKFNSFCIEVRIFSHIISTWNPFIHDPCFDWKFGLVFFLGGGLGPSKNRGRLCSRYIIYIAVRFVMFFVVTHSNESIFQDIIQDLVHPIQLEQPLN